MSITDSIQNMKDAEEEAVIYTFSDNSEAISTMVRRAIQAGIL